MQSQVPGVAVSWAYWMHKVQVLWLEHILHFGSQVSARHFISESVSTESNTKNSFF